MRGSRGRTTTLTAQPSPASTAQIACVVALIGQPAYDEIGAQLRIPTASEFAAAGSCGFPLPDADGDGIFDILAGVDTDPLPSSDFVDNRPPIPTIGSITGLGAQIVVVGDALDPVSGAVNPAEGVEFGTSPGGGATPATFSACGGQTTWSQGPGFDYLVTCSSVTVTVLGSTVPGETIDVTLLGDDGTVATVSLGTGFGLTFDPETLEITAPAGNPGPITVIVNGTEVLLASGGGGFLSPEAAVDSLISDVEALGLANGIENSLISKLNAAKKSLERGKDRAAANQLTAFINEVEAQRGKKIADPVSAASDLIAAATAIIDSIPGSP